MRPSKEAIQRSRRVFTPELKATILRRHLTAALQDGRTERGVSQTASAGRARRAALEAIIAKNDRVIAEVSEEYLDMKKIWGPMKGRWVPPNQCNAVEDCVRALLTPHGPAPREQHLTQAERDGILAFHDRHPLHGYRQLAYMMVDAGEVAVRPASVYRVLQAAY